jgi:hypothetical protein
VLQLRLLGPGAGVWPGIGWGHVRHQASCLCCGCSGQVLLLRWGRQVLGKQFFGKEGGGENRFDRDQGYVHGAIVWV